MRPSAAMNVIHAVTTTRASYGGPSRSVPFLCEALAGQGASVQLVTTVPGSGENGQSSILPADPVKVCRAGTHDGLLQTLKRPLSFYRALHDRSGAPSPDLIHDHGLWLPTHGTIALAARRLGVPLVVSTRGMLTPWALQHNRWRKRLVWTAYQKWALQQAALFHVTSEEEVEALRDLGFDQPVALIPNGVQLPELNGTEASSSRRRRALFLSRLHPKKGLPMLIEAWTEARPEGWELVLVGPSEEGHRAELEEQVRSQGLGDRITFAGPVSDEEKWPVYRSADLFVLPTYSENFGIVVAEALAAGVPVITTTGTPWRELEAQGCGWWVAPEKEAIGQALGEAVHATDEQRRAMGQRGRQLVEDRYSWQGVAQQMHATYRWLADEGGRPGCIRTA
ncbi:glycosyltransferase [Salinibacter ruber]|uniref:glycosyltransferase n=1 Tax=Salinibacter ruber TaxID=146919 RepID=UPI00311B2B7A